MAKAKCRVCGVELDTKTAHRVVDKNGKPKYFCSEAEFIEEEARKVKAQQDKDKVYRLVCDIMGEKEIISTALFKEWQVWLKVADNSKISQYLEENKDYLTSVIARLGSSEYAKIRYLSAIIRDKIKGFAPKVEVKVIIEEVPATKIAVDQTLEIRSNITNTNNRRRSFDEME